jgi:hypothetical protein
MALNRWIPSSVEVKWAAVGLQEQTHNMLLHERMRWTDKPVARADRADRQYGGDMVSLTKRGNI